MFINGIFTLSLQLTSKLSTSTKKARFLTNQQGLKKYTELYVFELKTLKKLQKIHPKNYMLRTFINDNKSSKIPYFLNFFVNNLSATFPRALKLALNSALFMSSSNFAKLKISWCLLATFRTL
jgi:hypothetical protein